MAKTKAQEWFLIKKNWMEDLEDLTNEDFGLIVRSLYNGTCPEGSQKVLYKALKDEYDRVNESREDGLMKRREASKKGNETKAQKEPSGNPLNARTHTHTHTNTHIQTKILTEDKEDVNKGDIWYNMINE